VGTDVCLLSFVWRESFTTSTNGHAYATVLRLSVVCRRL